MEIDAALRILRTLSDGIDPVTREIFPPESPYQRPDTIRALLKAVYSLEKMQGKTSRQGILTGNAGKPWTEEEEKLLMVGFDQGVPFSELSKKHGRTLGAIKSRLVKLGKISSMDS